jgi:hypothetical protein
MDVAVPSLTYVFIAYCVIKVRDMSPWPITVAARSNTGAVGSNPTRDMDSCVVLLCVGRGLATG